MEFARRWALITETRCERGMAYLASPDSDVLQLSEGRESSLTVQPPAFRIPLPFLDFFPENPHCNEVELATNSCCFALPVLGWI